MMRGSGSHSQSGIVHLNLTNALSDRSLREQTAGVRKGYLDVEDAHLSKYFDSRPDFRPLARHSRPQQLADLAFGPRQVVRRDGVLSPHPKRRLLCHENSR
jgi:hypothetical protein